MSKFVVLSERRHALETALCEAAGIDPRYVRRLVLDLRATEPGMLYLETFADDAILDVSIADLGVTIEEKGA